jgi:hypothetical protein
MRVLLYAPQVSEWGGQRHLVAYGAVGVEIPGAEKLALGSVKVEADTKVSLDERLVNFSDLTLTEANFPTLSKDQAREITTLIVKSIPDEDRMIALDRVLAAVDKSQIIPKNIEGVKADPPAIFFSQTPAVLLNIDGDPIWSPIKDNDLKFAVNTNWDLFQHEPTKTYYLLNGDAWLKTTDLKGKWEAAGQLPESFQKLPADDNWKDVRANLPGKKGKPTTVFVSTIPAELILLQGAPNYLLVQGTANLLWVSNTESDVFRMGQNGPVYFLVSGRWFSSPGFEGPWTFATPKMPEVFQSIPLEHPRSRVLAAVPGTQQAAEAVLLAQVPQTARVNKKEIKAPEVTYQGDPKFQPIEKTTLEYAVNTDKQIVKFGDLYYMCFQGVWFMSQSATGPWEVCTSVPKEIYDIPSSSPVHNVTYVTVVEDDPSDDWATFAVVAGYTGLMVAWGCAVWGSGWYYPPYWGWGGGFYPYYYPHYPTYGYGAWYNPWTGAYGRSAVAYGPYGGAGISARYNPTTGTYSRGAAAWGPGGYRAAGQAYNPRTGTYAQTRQGGNVYGSWGSTSVQRGDQWAQTARVTNNRTGTTTRVTQGSGGGEAITRNPPGAGTGGGVARTGSGDVYAGRDGNVYKKTDDGWQKYDGSGNWSNVERPETGVGARDQAATRDAAGAQARDQTATRDAAAAQARDRAAAGAGTAGATRPTTTDRPGQAGGGISTMDRGTVDQLNRDARARSEGAQRTRDAGTARAGGYGGGSAGSYRPSGGGMRPGGGGGGRRR